jgi:hypothetical protein
LASFEDDVKKANVENLLVIVMVFVGMSPSCGLKQEKGGDECPQGCIGRTGDPDTRRGGRTSLTNIHTAIL